MKNAIRAATAAIAIAGMTTIASAQTSAPDPHHPDAALPQASPSPEPSDRGEGRPAQSGMMGGEMMGGMMQGGMMGQGRMGVMSGSGHVMKVMFAITDLDGDGALSLDEIAAIHKRIFVAIDADKDGKATREELKTFMHD
jgi:hypothetical protein